MQPSTVRDAPPGASIATVVIDNGERNLLDPDLMSHLCDVIETADADPGTTGIVLTGGGSVFCGGLDVSAIQAGADPLEFARSLVRLLSILPRLGTPVAAVVNGDALASGASLV